MTEKPAKSPASTFVMLLAFGAVFMVMFNPGLRQATAGAVGVLFEPTIAFPAKPMWTIFFAGVFMILGTTVLRHFLVDWKKMARTQEVMRAFQKEFSQARKSNNTYKIKRLTEMQPELMQMQASMSTDQMKPMAFTMIIVIPIFAWLLHFVEDMAATRIVRMPWNGEWDLLSSWWILPRWILLYSLFSIPFGTLTQKMLKLWEYSKVDLDGDGKPAGKTG